MAAHVFGYVGEVNDAQVSESEGLKSGDIVGQAGVEKWYNTLLMGTDGAKRVVVNSVGREIRTLEEEEPTEGKRLQLTLDYDVQRAIEDGFDQLGFNGAAVMLDPSNGDVLGFTSRPAYDPNAFAAGIDRGTWASLMNDEDLPLSDRAIQGTYSPGSTFKMAVATAALQEGVITPDFKVHCSGGATVSVSIGKASVAVTRVSMAVYEATLANGGTRVTPHLLQAVDEGSGWKPVAPPEPKSRAPLDADKLQAIRDGLFLVVNGAGTGHNATLNGYDGSGKTGTAQVISNQGKERAGKTDKDLRDNGWFVFFAPRDKPEIAGVVFLEHGVHGSNAALIARHLMETFFAKKEGRPLPPKPDFKPNLVP